MNKESMIGNYFFDSTATRLISKALKQYQSNDVGIIAVVNTANGKEMKIGYGIFESNYASIFTSTYIIIAFTSIILFLLVIITRN